MKQKKGRRNSIHVIKIYFWVGVVSAILLRTIIIADHHSGLAARLLWYAGVLGYLLFFSHRYNIAKRRVGVIKDLNLLEKIQTREPLQSRTSKGSIISCGASRFPKSV